MSGTWFSGLDFSKRASVDFGYFSAAKPVAKDQSVSYIGIGQRKRWLIL